MGGATVYRMGMTNPTVPNHSTNLEVRKMTNEIFSLRPAPRRDHAWMMPWLALATAAPAVWQSLRPVERTVATLRFPVVQSYRGWRRVAKSLDEVAAATGLTRAEVRHAEARYLAAYRHPTVADRVAEARERILSRD